MALSMREGIIGKVCSTCRTWKPLGEFPPDRTHGASQGGRHCRCRACHRAKSKAIRSELREWRAWRRRPV
jgi:hypothetical protein